MKQLLLLVSCSSWASHHRGKRNSTKYRFPSPGSLSRCWELSAADLFWCQWGLELSHSVLLVSDPALQSTVRGPSHSPCSQRCCCVLVRPSVCSRLGVALLSRADARPFLVSRLFWPLHTAVGGVCARQLGWTVLSFLLGVGGSWLRGRVG